MLHTTFNLLREANACEEGYRKLAKSLGGVTKYGRDTPIPLTDVLGSNGLDDALWCLRATVERADGFARDISCDCAERALHLVDNPDQRSARAVEVARRHARGEATDDELAAAWAAARAAARAAAWDAAWAAAWAAEQQWQSERLRVRLLAHDADTNPLGLLPTITTQAA